MTHERANCSLDQVSGTACDQAGGIPQLEVGAGVTVA